MGERLVRSLVAVGRRVGYIGKPSIDDAVNTDPSEGVGFPLTNLFQFDAKLLDALTSAFESGDVKRLEDLWGRAKPLPL